MQRARAGPGGRRPAAAQRRPGPDPQEPARDARRRPRCTQTYLKKLSDQEKEIDALTAKQKKLMADEFAARKKYDDYLANISD